MGNPDGFNRHIEEVRRIFREMVQPDEVVVLGKIERIFSFTGNAFTCAVAAADNDELNGFVQSLEFGMDHPALQDTLRQAGRNYDVLFERWEVVRVEQDMRVQEGVANADRDWWSRDMDAWLEAEGLAAIAGRRAAVAAVIARRVEERRLAQIAEQLRLNLEDNRRFDYTAADNDALKGYFGNLQRLVETLQRQEDMLRIFQEFDEMLQAARREIAKREEEKAMDETDEAGAAAAAEEEKGE